MSRVTIDLTNAASEEIDRMCEYFEMSKPDLFRSAMSLLRTMSPNRAAAAENLAAKVDQFLQCKTEPNIDEMRFALSEFNDFNSPS